MKLKPILINTMQSCLVAGLLVFSSCNPEGNNNVNFDRAAMLENIGSNIIIPNYSDLSGKLNLMEQAANDFTSAPDNAKLTALQTAFKNAYLSWQKCSAFEFGPAMQVSLRMSVNTFPTDSVQIQNNITSGSYNLETANNIDARGFPAMDYLLHKRNGSNAEVLERFTINSDAQAWKDYLLALVNDTKNLVEAVKNSWEPTSGNYLTTFISNDGTDVGSSLGELVNQLNYDYEQLKNARIGIPAGKQTLGVALPEKCEAYYAGYSVELAIEQITAIKNLYLGAADVDGIGLDEYLVALDAKHGSGQLSDAIKTQLDLATAALQNVPDPLSETVVNNQTIVNTAYTEIQKGVVLLKTDMPSALSVLITYQDGDGD
jgi:predicted lipoprotein